ncbi:hypothetical protein Gpo141_00004951 [Globisporangium polare]
MERRGVGKRLTDGQRVEIIKLFDSGAAVTEADIARRYGVSRSAIWRLRRSSSHIMERYQEGDIESRDERRRGSLGSSSRQFTMNPAGANNPAAAVATATVTTNANANLEADENESMSVSVDALTAMTPGLTTAMLTTNNGHVANNNSNNMGGAGGMMMVGMMDQSSAGPHHVLASGGMLGGNVAINANAAAGAGARARPRTNAAAGVAPAVAAAVGNDARAFSIASSSITGSEMELTPGAVVATVPESALPLIYMSAKAISSVQSPGVINWERLNGYDDANHFMIVNDGISVVNEGTYQINIDLEHSQPRQNYKFVFKVWNGKKLIGQCGCPLRTKKEISLSVLEMRCKLQLHARLRVEFLAAGFAFHESRIVIRLVQ